MSLTAVNLDQETWAKLNLAADARSISPTEMLKKAIDAIACDDALLAAAVERSRTEIARGEYYTQEQIEAENQRLRQEIMARKCG